MFEHFYRYGVGVWDLNFVGSDLQTFCVGEHRESFSGSDILTYFIELLNKELVQEIIVFPLCLLVLFRSVAVHVTANKPCLLLFLLSEGPLKVGHQACPPNAMNQEEPFDFFGELLVADLSKIEAFDEVLEFNIFELFETFDDTSSKMGLLLNKIWLHFNRLLKLLIFQSVFLHQSLPFGVSLF